MPMSCCLPGLVCKGPLRICLLHVCACYVSSLALLAARAALAELARPMLITTLVHVRLLVQLQVCAYSVSSLALLAAMPALAELARPCGIHASAHMLLRLLILLDRVWSPHWCTCGGLLFADVLLFARLGLLRAAAYLLAASVRLLCCLSCAACCDGRACSTCSTDGDHHIGARALACSAALEHVQVCLRAALACPVEQYIHEHSSFVVGIFAKDNLSFFCSRLINYHFFPLFIPGHPLPPMAQAYGLSVAIPLFHASGLAMPGRIT